MKLLLSILLIALFAIQAFSEAKSVIDATTTTHSLSEAEDGGENLGSLIKKHHHHHHHHHPRTINCSNECSRRCSKASRKKICLRACKTCCARCHCVPPGTYGNKDLCPCYASLRTHGNRPKCP
ncbi:hypothetical protein ABFS82_03G110100 [Erythranthe guttata]|uniref:Gibberellin-regulated protein 9 n=1 Tax=Erythranthe guttata TaxID=4155 RepID=A0A022Q8H6_ERYGU|nr:PREDICTED: gibberellin-regulated protein 9 [Erythranthe guttata]EYU22850.1 hypothetical protein MIMGU_mgv1a016408mg [Erythranthe guttata]|eukprot:XP_012854742.1 PREDICTED: gibberellin-regulated protein 9 [Erythranthe guttata]